LTVNRHTEAVPTTGTPSTASIAEQIRSGSLDDEIPSLIAAINSRNAELDRRRAEAARARLSVGTRVILGATASPKYLRGQTGEIHEMLRDSIVVCLDHPIGRFTDRHITCPPQLLTPMD
jgi:hypothetical protein